LTFIAKRCQSVLKHKKASIRSSDKIGTQPENFASDQSLVKHLGGFD